MLNVECLCYVFKELQITKTAVFDRALCFFFKLMLTKDKIIIGKDKGYPSTPGMIELRPTTHEFLKHSETWDKTRYTVAVIR